MTPKNLVGKSTELQPPSLDVKNQLGIYGPPLNRNKLCLLGNLIWMSGTQNWSCLSCSPNWIWKWRILVKYSQGSSCTSWMSPFSALLLFPVCVDWFEEKNQRIWSHYLYGIKQLSKNKSCECFWSAMCFQNCWEKKEVARGCNSHSTSLTVSAFQCFFCIAMVYNFIYIQGSFHLNSLDHLFIAGLPTFTGQKWEKKYWSHVLPKAKMKKVYRWVVV